MTGHFKSECKNPSKEKALMAKGGDDGDMMLMVEVCELIDEDSPAPKGKGAGYRGCHAHRGGSLSS